MKTSTIIEYGAIDVTAKSDSTITTNNQQDFSKLNELKGNIQEKKYSTLEKNYFVLDGKSENISDTVKNVGYWSKLMSDSNGEFSTPLVMTITFNQVHNSIGLNLVFSQYTYCNHLEIQYYDSSNSILADSTYYPDKYEYFCEEIVSNYKKIIITFYSTNIPYRYLKLYDIQYGKAVTFEGDKLLSANLLEQANLISDELSINTLEFVVFSDNDEFNILNPQGKYRTLEQGQYVNTYMIAGNETRYMGTYYLDSWKNENDNKMDFSAIDLIGILDKSDFMGGRYNGVTLQNVVSEIMTSAGLSSESYTISNDVKNIRIWGYIPICSHREALQQVLFYAGALANCARSDKIKIYKAIEEQNPNTIYKSNVLKGTRTIEQGKVITGVQVTVHKYVYEKPDEKETLFDEEVSAGISTITFSEPATSIECTGATILSSGVNYAKISKQTAGQVTILGYKLTHKTQTVLVEDSQLSENAKTNILKVDNIQLITTTDSAQNIATRILEYYKNSYETTFDFILDDEKPADNVIVEESFDNDLNGYVTELDIDMIGGYITKGKVFAKVSESNG